ncbi:hypothetical protein P3T18_001459 [Paraburkholderia sp. GAS199]|uniref:DUF2844 domain-containing protein n=1 Tax=Paraburkholderia sp. GAS199 TaxID=3035126 RepID=UPI003D1BF060
MRFLTIAVIAASFVPLASHATLGSAPSAAAPAASASSFSSSSSTSSSMLRAAPQSPAGGTSATSAPYSVTESRDVNGVTIREYVLPGNVVFAVTWVGPIRPDMTVLLGRYFPHYVDAQKKQARNASASSGASQDFRVESGGRLGHFFGTAYLPKLVPAGVVPGDLQ